MKKLLSVTCIALSLTFSTPFFANAAAFESIAAIQDQSEVQPNAEQTQWYVRVTEDGTLQKCLWSITCGKWLTDWIDVV